MNEELRHKLNVLEQEISVVQDGLEKVLSEIYDLEKRRRVLLLQIRELKAESKRYRDRLNVLKEEIRELNETLHVLKRERSEKISSLKGLKEKMREYLRTKSKPQMSEESLETEISKLEWMIQTTPLSLEEEKRIIERIKSLEEQLHFYKELKSMRDRSQTIKRSIEEIGEKINLYANMIMEKISEKRGLQERLTRIFGEITTMKLELERVDKEYCNKREKVSELRSKHRDLVSQIRAIRKIIKEEEEKRKLDQKLALKEKIKEEILKKIKRGEKVSFEEFRVFLEEDANNI